jgi:hypothetical protein
LVIQTFAKFRKDYIFSVGNIQTFAKKQKGLQKFHSVRKVVKELPKLVGKSVKNGRKLGRKSAKCFLRKKIRLTAKEMVGEKIFKKLKKVTKIT